MQETLGDRIRNLRESAGMTQMQLAEAVGVSRSAIGMYEHDEREPDLDKIEAIADVFNVSMSSLTERKGELQPNPITKLKLDRLTAIFHQLDDQNQRRILDLSEVLLRGQAPSADSEDSAR